MSRQPTVREGGRFWTLCQLRQATNGKGGREVLDLVSVAPISTSSYVGNKWRHGFLNKADDAWRHEQGSREGGRFRTLCQSRRSVLVPTWEINGANQSYHISARFLKD
jgi:hypothetical protein